MKIPAIAKVDPQTTHLKTPSPSWSRSKACLEIVQGRYSSGNRYLSESLHCLPTGTMWSQFAVKNGMDNGNFFWKIYQLCWPQTTLLIRVSGMWDRMQALRVCTCFAWYQRRAASITCNQNEAKPALTWVQASVFCVSRGDRCFFLFLADGNLRVTDKFAAIRNSSTVSGKSHGWWIRCGGNG